MSFPIRAFVGANGSGKTLAAVELAVLPALESGRDVVANFGLSYPPNPRLVHRLESWRDLTKVRGSLIVLDEISRVAPSRAAMSMPPQLYGILDQLRKDDLEVVWMAPAWGRADSILRAVTGEVTTCRGMLVDRFERPFGVVPPWWRVWAPAGRARVDRRWLPNTLFRWKTYDAMAFEEFTVHAVKDVRPLASYWYLRSWHRAQFMYDTLESVSALDNISDIGLCVECGGRRSPRRCTCQVPGSGRGVSASAGRAAGGAGSDEGGPLGVSVA